MSFVQCLPRNMVLLNFKLNKVLFPEVSQFVFTLARSTAPVHHGLRDFNKHLSPGFKLFNPHCEFVTQVVKASPGKPVHSSVQITFKNGQNYTLHTDKKNALDIWHELTRLGKGKSFAPRRKMTPCELEKPTLLQPDN